MMKQLKYWIIGHEIGLIDRETLKQRCEDWISNEEWSEVAYDLSTESFYKNGSINKALEITGFRPTEEEFGIIESELLPYLKYSLSENVDASDNVIDILYRYLKMKIDILNLTSNDIGDDWFGIMNQYELSNDGIKGSLENKEDLIKWLNKQEM